MSTANTSYDKLRLDLGDRSYSILIGDGLIENAADHIAPLLSGNKVIVVSDENVAPHWLDKLLASFDGHPFIVEKFILPASETTKSFRHFQDLTERILATGIDRKTTLVALGGGVIGDLVGFAAAVLLRGIDFVQIPTTLLSQVDSSVGGKTGINSAHGKNLIGAFHQPKLVLADIGVLDTLPKRDLLAGYGEVVKYGLIDDFDFFEWCEINADALINGDHDARRHAVYKSCESKARIVAEDEREAGRRALLNLGHTFGHALEAEVGYGDKLLHGEAVAIGCTMAFNLSVRLGLCPSQDSTRVYSHFAQVGLKNDLSDLAQPNWTAELLLAHMSKDKKAIAGKATFILARGIGQSFVASDVENSEVIAVLDEVLKATAT